MQLRLSGILAALALSALPAIADPVSIHGVRDILNTVGLKGNRIGILYGQPMVSGELQGIGTVAALRRCSPGDPATRTCEEVALKSCIELHPDAGRLEMLEAVNHYNLQSYAGLLALDTNDLLGNVICVFHFVDLRDENVFGLDEAYTWTQAITDFRSYLIDKNIPLLRPEQL